ncbi:hypothetical protein A2154_01930 [Candidatus Gottesmanbacteria bacterium RBG_16_43_7]|uniref:DUF5666 domain-containing protein n=1 Tax=Candidatus Gottesmanbacteria bacterium RBG_16_43_7 TaxID=1798373 RepID=A0A1F5Z873_9BACT|nr:MAG: hypothetical protein A2154_01930 [Candidatus Gottesmanbacteria bacterium RBG_16_43_7]
MNASVIYIQEALRDQIIGTITGIDEDGYSLTVRTWDNKVYNVDYETSTKASKFESGGEKVKIGFSKLAITDRIVAYGLSDNKENTITAVRLTIFGMSPTKPSIEPTTAGSPSANTR